MRETGAASPASSASPENLVAKPQFRHSEHCHAPILGKSVRSARYLRKAARVRGTTKRAHMQELFSSLSRPRPHHPSTHRGQPAHPPASSPQQWQPTQTRWVPPTNCTTSRHTMLPTLTIHRNCPPPNTRRGGGCASTARLQRSLAVRG